MGNAGEIKLEKLVYNIEESKVDMVSAYDDWTNVAFAIANYCGEEGREYFKRIARLSANYSEEENDKKYNNALKTANGGVGIGTLLYIAKQHNVDTSNIYTAIGRVDTSYLFRPQYKPVVTDEFKEEPYYSENGIPNDYVEKALPLGTQTTLFHAIANISGLEEKTKEVFEKYKVGGTTTLNGSLFWQIDKNGICHDGKLIHYKNDGHRDKEKGIGANWIHKMCEKSLPSSYLFKQCIYGEFQLQHQTCKRIFLVESEKTALIGSVFYDFKCMWMATGGIGNLSATLLIPLMGKSPMKNKIILFPDKDGEKTWTAKADILKKFGLKIYIAKWWDFVSEVNDKDDIADAIFRIWEKKDTDGQKKLADYLDNLPIIEEIVFCNPTAL